MQNKGNDFDGIFNQKGSRNLKFGKLFYLNHTTKNEQACLEETTNGVFKRRFDKD